METVVMPAGEYVICDPCYVIPDCDWDRFTDVPEQELTKFTLSSGEEISVWYASTLYGDGVFGAISYLGEHELSVDSGCIGIIQRVPGLELSQNYSIVHHTTSRKFDIDYDGSLFNIGPWEINTGDSPHCEDDYFYPSDEFDEFDE